MGDRSYIGQRLPRREDYHLLTGRGTFVGDISIPRMWDMGLVRSEVAHARIEAGELDAARSMRGVALAIDGKTLAKELGPCL